jgi:uncharacterized membrane protein
MASRRSSARAAALLAYSSGGLTAVLLLVVFGGRWSAAALVLGGLAGIAGMVGLVLFFQALATGRFQIVSPAAAVMSGLVPVAVGLVLGERPAALAVAGILSAPFGVWLLAGGRLQAPTAADLAPLARALAAGAAFGAFFALYAQTPDDAGAVPLVATRATSVAGLGLVSLALGGAVLPAAGRVPAVVSGVLDMFANGLFLLASRIGDLVVVGPLVALFPVSSAVLARLVLKERLAPLQRVGFVLAVASAVLLSA